MSFKAALVAMDDIISGMEYTPVSQERANLFRGHYRSWPDGDSWLRAFVYSLPSGS